jgi:putative PIN family toxin of toxin-antitoxin system
MKNKLNVVLDTNVLLVSISSKSKYHRIYKNLIDGVFSASITNEILMEYEEIISSKFNRAVSQNVIRALIMLPNIHQVNVYYKWNLILNDPDDNKFVDCAIASNANYIVSNDQDFSILKDIEFPKVDVIPIIEFEKIIKRII